MQNRELEAMGKLVQAVDGLDAKELSRSVTWLIGHLGIEIGTGLTKRVGERATTAAESLGDDAALNGSTFAELFHAAAPTSEKEKALVAAYWIQKSKGADQFGSQEVNTELKHIGFGIGNITDALSQLMNEKPNLVIQLKKGGASKQARKTYKVTDAGVRKVQQMISHQEE